jgi:hypothetical protein
MTPVEVGQIPPVEEEVVQVIKCSKREAVHIIVTPLVNVLAKPSVTNIL